MIHHTASAGPFRAIKNPISSMLRHIWTPAIGVGWSDERLGVRNMPRHRPECAVLGAPFIKKAPLSKITLCSDHP